MNRLIKGDNFLLQLKIDGDYYDIFCAKSGEFLIEQEEREVTTITSGSDREFNAGMSAGTLTASGLTTIDNAEDKISALYLMQQSVRRQKLEWRCFFTADNGDTQQATFSGIIRSVSIPKDGFAYVSSTLVVRISGAVTFSDIVVGPTTSYEYFSDYWDTVNGQNYVTGASSGEYTGTAYTLTDTDTVLMVDYEGTSFNLVTGTPTQGERECRFITTAPVRVVFPSDLIPDGTQRVFIMFKRPV